MHGAKQRNRVVRQMKWYENCYKMVKLSESFGIPESTISCFKKRVEREGSVENICRRGWKSAVTSRDYLDTGKACEIPQKKGYYGPIQRKQRTASI